MNLLGKFFFICFVLPHVLSCGKKPHVSPNSVDPLLNDQWHLDMIDVKNLWQQNIKGQGIKILVVDDGVEIKHKDLKDNFSTTLSYNFETKSNDPTEADYHHGTMVSGVIFARDHNFTGISGIAPRSIGLGVNLLANSNSTLSNIITSLTRNIDKIHISNNSWGFTDGLGHLWKPSSEIISALQYGVENGRNKKGTIYVWAAGNGGDFGIDQSNYDGLANLPQVFTICAVGPDFLRAEYSEIGANLLVCAPSKKQVGDIGILTTDGSGELGKNSTTNKYSSLETNNTDYTNSFDGTSASAPIVAGICALLLQKYPLLSYRDVRLILAQSATQIDPTNLDWVQNSSGYYVNHSYGFGLVNASAALSLAAHWTRVGKLKTFEKSYNLKSIEGPLTDGGGDSDSLYMDLEVANSGISKIEFVQITTNISHTDWGNLNIYLQRTIGDKSWYEILSRPRKCKEEDKETDKVCTVSGNSFTFGSLRHMGEPADGTWTLIVNDDIPENTGRVLSWKITFYGE